MAWRSLLKNKTSSFINIFGLAIGIASFLWIFIFVSEELSYDKCWKDYERIYRVNQIITVPAKSDPFSVTSIIFGPAINKAIQGHEEVTRVLAVGPQSVWVNGQSHRVDGHYFVDSNLFKVFDFPFLEGDPGTALLKPNTIVISKEYAQLLFGDESALGKTLKYARLSYTITGVFDDSHLISHFKPKGLLTWQSINPDILSESQDDWFRLSTTTYVKLKQGETKQAYQAKISIWKEQVILPWINKYKLKDRVDFELLNVADIHFDTFYIYDSTPKSSKEYIYIFSFVAIFLLLTACFNYMNLTTAHASNRAKEVGIRKVVGADRRQIVFQFLCESLLTACFSLFVALMLVELLSPGYEMLTGNKYEGIVSILNWPFVIASVIVITLIGLVGGSYPAFYLSAFRPVDVLKSKTNHAMTFSVARLRKVLVIIQFALAIGLVSSTLVVWDQFWFMNQKNLGFNKDQVAILNFPAGDKALALQMPSIQRQLSQLSYIKSFSIASNLPAFSFSRILFYVGDSIHRKEYPMNVTFCSYNFPKVLEMEMVKGRFYSPDIPEDTLGCFVVNEACVKLFGWKNPIGQVLENGFGKGRVIGVIKDYHYESVHKPIEPMVLMLSPQVGAFLLIKLQSDNRQQNYQKLSKLYQQLFPGHPFRMTYLSDKLYELYGKEKTMIAILGYFSILTILISCMGLFGLSYFIGKQRTKEIGIRRVMGANWWQISLVFSKDFVILVSISIVISIPITWLVMDYWLSGFAYHIKLSLLPFLGASVVGMLLAILTVSLVTANTAKQSPVEALKHE